MKMNRMKKAMSLLLSLVFIAGLLVTPAMAAGGRPSVSLSKQYLSVDAKFISCEKYNIDGSNYFKLRDLAYLLNGTKSQFSVGWDARSNTVTISTGAAYRANGTELKTGRDLSSTAVRSSQTILIDGRRVSNLSVYNIGGSNFFKLRDLGNSLGFRVDYNAVTQTALVYSSGFGIDISPATPSNWNGQWYGWWQTYNATGKYAETMEKRLWDCCASVNLDANGKGTVIIWDHDLPKYDAVAELQVQLVDNKGGGALVVESGWFMDAEMSGDEFYFMKHTERDTSVGVQDGFYQTERGSYNFNIFLIPWGGTWDHLGQEEYWPPHYMDWYLPLIRQNKPAPDVMNLPSGQW